MDYYLWPGPDWDWDWFTDEQGIQYPDYSRLAVRKYMGKNREGYKVGDIFFENGQPVGVVVQINLQHEMHDRITTTEVTYQDHFSETEPHDS